MWVAREPRSERVGAPQRSAGEAMPSRRCTISIFLVAGALLWRGRCGALQPGPPSASAGPRVFVYPLPDEMKFGEFGQWCTGASSPLVRSEWLAVGRGRPRKRQ